MSQKLYDNIIHNLLKSIKSSWYSMTWHPLSSDDIESVCPLFSILHNKADYYTGWFIRETITNCDFPLNSCSNISTTKSVLGGS